MSGNITPRPVKKLAGQIRKELNRRNLVAPVKTRTKRIDKVDHWEVVARGVPVDLDSALPGHWRLNLSWTFTPVPADDVLKVLQSSIGLYGVGVPVLGGDGEERCLVRYDVDNNVPGPNLGPLGPHLNVTQPGKLADRVHYALPGLAGEPWSVSEVLDVLLSDRLIDDLRDRLE